MEKKLRNAAELFVESLEKEGVKYIFGVPGEENLAFLEAVRKSKIIFITTRHEQAAMFMAATVGRLTGKVGVALSTLGPGATNLVTGIAFAQLGGMPVLAITGQKPVKKSKQGKFQILDIVRMMLPLTKFSSTIVSSERIPSIVHEAIKIAEGERPGAVHLELPEDIAAEKTRLLPIISEKARRPVPDKKAVIRAVEAIEAAKHPIIIIASGANRKLVRKQLKEFLKKTGIPFVTTQMGKGVEDENSSCFIGTTALSAGDFVHKALEYADTVIMLGHDISEKPPIILTPERHKLIHVNFTPAETDDVYIPTHEVIGDISHALWTMTEQIVPQKHWNFEYMFKIKNALSTAIARDAKSTSFPLLPQKIVSLLREALPKDGILALDNGMYKIWIARNYPAYEQNSVLLDNALATMGAGLPSGIAAKLLFPEKKVVVISGDGGIMMNISEIETARRLGIDLVVVILTDGGYGMIRWKQEDAHFEEFGLRFQNPDFVKLAESFGVKGYKITSAKNFAETLEKTINSKGIHVIDCPIDYSKTYKALGEDLKRELKGL